MTQYWRPGTTYLPGDLVQPRSGSTTVTLPANLNFASGDTEWTKEPGWAINNFPGVDSAWRAETNTAGNSEIINNVKVPVVPGQHIEVHAYGLTAGGNSFAVGLEFYDATQTQLPGTSGSYLSPAATSTGAWIPCGGVAIVPAGASYAAMVGSASVVNTGNAVSMSNFAWNYQVPPSAVGLIFKAVQAAAGVSAQDEPAWPTTNGLTVVDNTVTWEAVQISRVIWKAVPIYKSATSEPDWPTTPGGSVADGTIVWECITRQVEDENCPHSKVVTIAAGKVFAADGDIIRFCSTANPLDWTLENDAGYLPSGLQQANANDMAVLNIYRGNVAAFNASSFQMWQADPDPSAMALLDQMDGIGSRWARAAQAVGNELLFLSQLGVRSVGIAGASTNLQAGDVGMPVDVLVQEQLAVDGVKPLATYYPSAGQYWLAFSRVEALNPPATGEMQQAIFSGGPGNGADYSFYLPSTLYTDVADNTCTPDTWDAVVCVSGAAYAFGAGIPSAVSPTHCVTYDDPDSLTPTNSLTIDPADVSVDLVSGVVTIAGSQSWAFGASLLDLYFTFDGHLSGQQHLTRVQAVPG